MRHSPRRSWISSIYIWLSSPFSIIPSCLVSCSCTLSLDVSKLICSLPFLNCPLLVLNCLSLSQVLLSSSSFICPLSSSLVSCSLLLLGYYLLRLLLSLSAPLIFLCQYRSLPLGSFCSKCLKTVVSTIIRFWHISSPYVQQTVLRQIQEYGHRANCCSIPCIAVQLLQK